MTQIRSTESAAIDSLKPHPRNYRSHPEDQLDHIQASIEEHGFYRNVVTAKDGTILAGHGVVLASKRMGLKEVPIIRLEVEPESQQALKVMASDNTLSHLAQDDDRMLADLLKELGDADDLIGTGYDEQMLAALAMVTRPQSELEDFDEAAEWAGAGMPEFESKVPGPKLVLMFDNDDARDALVDDLGVFLTNKTGKTFSAFYPPRELADTSSVAFVTGDEDEAEELFG